VFVVLCMVGFLLYGRARAYGVPGAVARRTVIEIWVAAVAALAALTIATWAVPAARVAPWGVLHADARGWAIAAVTVVFCIAAAVFALSRARRLMDSGQPPSLGSGEDGDPPEDVGC
ncbi:MAG: hypothetical protein PVH68_12375, partial [Armatimonadota bacterium]